MEEYFENQLGKTEPITEEVLPQLKGKSFYSEYKIGDEILYFLKEKESSSFNQKELELTPIVSSDIDVLDEFVDFVRVAGIFPVFINKK